MAKVALICRDWTEPARNFALALHEQHHEVFVLTSKNQDFSETQGISILACFENWNWREMVELVPHLLRLNPDIFHFFQVDKDPEFTQAHWLLALYGKSIPRRATALSSFHRFTTKDSRFMQLFLKLQDLVTVGNRENLMFLRRNHWLRDKSLSEIIPPFTAMPQLNAEKPTEDPELARLLESLKPFVLVPGGFPNTFAKSQLSELSGLNILFFAERPRKAVEKNFFFLDRSVFSQDFQTIASAAKVCVSAGLDFSLLELVQLQKILWQAKCALISDPHQSEILPGICMNGQNGFVHQDNKSIQQLLASCQDLSWSENHHLSVHGQLKDLAMNELARLYSKALQNAAQSLR